jgi:FkbM family methyltransferase
MLITAVKKIKNYDLKTLVTYALFEFYRFFYLRLFRSSYSLDGEDLVIDKLLDYKKIGFYVDLGANDPDRLSNTKRFYNRGWRGINVDANPQSIELVDKKRKRDINVNVGVGGESANMNFFVMFPPTVSTFVEKMKEQNLERGCEYIKTISVPIKTVSDILDEYLPAGVKIDFISIDLEGYDFIAIKSNNWSKYRPAVICIESATSYHMKKQDKQTFEITSYLNEVGYELAYHNGMDAFYKDKELLN